MSITNYFGKPRTKYVPYKSPYTFEHLPNSQLIYFSISPLYEHSPTKCKHYSVIPTPMNPSGMYDKIQLTDEELKIVQYESKKLDCPPQYLPLSFKIFEFQYNAANTTGHYKLKNIRNLFNDVIEECLKWIDYPIWKLLNIPPVISIYQIILLKISDVSKQAEHHESTIEFLVNDNTLLNNRIKALENSIALLIKKSNIPVAEPIAEHITVAEAVLKL